MGRGFLSGIFLGAIVSAVLLFVSSQVLERQTLSFPKPSASAVEVPAGTEFDQARPESDPVVPNSETRPSADAVVEAPVPDDAPDAPPALDTSALEVPTPEVAAPQTLETVAIEDSDAPTAPEGDSQASVGDVSELRTPDAPAAAPEAETETPEVTQAPLEDAAPETGAEDSSPVETEIAALPEAGADTDAAQDAETAPAVVSEDTAPSAPVMPEISTEQALPDPNVTVIELNGDDAPEVSEAPSQAPLIEIIEPAKPQPENATDAGTKPDSDPVVQESDADELPSFLRPVEVLENAGEVETGRLPQVAAGLNDSDAPVVPAPESGAEPETASPAQPAQNAEQESGADDRVAALPTIRRPGAESVPEIEAAQDEVVEAAASDLDSLPALVRNAVEFENPNGNPLLSVVLVNRGAPLTADQLDELPDVLAFGIEAGAVGAADAAKYYRAAGREVVMIPSLPQGATPQDVEQALRVNFDTVNQAVAVMDVSGGSFQSDRAAVSQVVDVVAESGHGLITFPRGLNTAHQRATRAGVATGLIFREMDAEGEDASQIQRTLDRAAFRARQDEAVILVGTTEQTTLIALVEWMLGNRAESVTLAPISAALAGGG